MAIIATGQISIVDFNDAPSLTAFVSSSSPKTQIYNPDNSVYTPNWTVNKPKLTPSLFISTESSRDQIASATVSWYDSTSPNVKLVTGGNYTVTGHELTINTNIMTGSIYSKTFIAEIAWTDPSTMANLIVKTDFTFGRANNGERGNTGSSGADAVFVTTWAPEGNIFKNHAVESLQIQCEVYKGGIVQTSGITYTWFKRTPGTTDEGGGLGWKKVTTANQAAEGITGSVTSNILTITEKGVLNVQAFKIKATYAGKSYVDTVILYDQTDPIMVTVDSSNGTIFKNGSVKSEMLCRLYQNGEEIDERLASTTVGYDYVYKWYKYKMDGVQDMAFGTAGVMLGKWINITDKDIFQKATFKVEVHDK